MPKSFGYLNEGNPLTIRDNEAQEMVNCAIERGWIEYKEYPVPTGLYDCVPNREVRLPDDYNTLLRIVNSADSYAQYGNIKMIRPDGSSDKLGIYVSGVFMPISLSAVEPTLTTNQNNFTDGYYCSCVSETNGIGDGLNTINIMNPYCQITGGGSQYFTYNEQFIERSTVVEVKLNNTILGKSDYTILNSGNGYPVIVLANPTPSLGGTNTLKVTWNHYFGDCLLIKETQQIFYAFTVEDDSPSYPATGTPSYGNSNYQKESIPFLTSINVINPELSTAKAKIIKITATMPTSNAVTPKLNAYRMPLGGDEYLFDFSVSTNITNYIDVKKDDELGNILETEGNTNSYLSTANARCIKLHNDRLFVATGKLLVFSKPSQFDQFPAENFYAFPDNVVDLCKYDSNLAVFTKTKSYIIYGAGTDGFVIAEVDWKTKYHIMNCAQSVYTKLISLTCETDILQNRRNSILLYNHRYAQDISLRVKDSLAKGVLRMNGNLAVLDSKNLDTANRNTVIENRYYVAELRYYDSATATDNQVKTFNLVYDVIADGFCLYDSSVKDFNNQAVFRYRTKEFKMVTPPTHQAQYHKGIYVKGKGTFKINVYSDGELLTSLTHTETDDSKPLRIILHNMGNKRGSTISLEFIGTQGAQIHDWEVYD